MGEKSATKEAVYAAANALKERGIKTTQVNVRKAVGKGSNSDIGPLLREWRIEQQTKGLSPRDPIPPPINERLTILGEEIWKTAIELATGRFDSERQALEEKLNESLEDLNGLSEETDRLTTENDALKENNVRLEEDAKTANEEASKLRAQLEVQGEKTKTIEVRAIELEKRATDLNAELARINAMNAELLKQLREVNKKK